MWHHLLHAQNIEYLKRIQEEYEGECLFRKNYQKDILMILDKSNTVTDEGRDDIVDADHATYKGDKFIVRGIYNISGKTELDKIEAGELSCSTYTDTNLYQDNFFCGTDTISKGDEIRNMLNPRLGIDFVKKLECLFPILCLDDSLTGIAKEWYANGAIKETTEYFKGIRHGNKMYYEKDSALIMKEIYRNNEPFGIHYTYEDGKVKSETHYSNGEKELVIEWHDKAKNKKASLDDLINDKFVMWDIDGNEINYWA